jgi:hypothetical protein
LQENKIITKKTFMRLPRKLKMKLKQKIITKLAIQKKEKAVMYNSIPAKTANVIFKMRHMACGTLRRIKQRARLFKKLNRPDAKGTPMYKRVGRYRMIIFPEDVALIRCIHIRTAQRYLQNLRLSLGKKRTGIITLKEYANFEEIDEDDLRSYLHDLDERRERNRKSNGDKDDDD